MGHDLRSVLLCEELSRVKGSEVEWISDRCGCILFLLQISDLIYLLVYVFRYLTCVEL
jgi:hypothetical protein